MISKPTDCKLFLHKILDLKKLCFFLRLQSNKDYLKNSTLFLIWYSTIFLSYLRRQDTTRRFIGLTKVKKKKQKLALLRSDSLLRFIASGLLFISLWAEYPFLLAKFLIDAAFRSISVIHSSQRYNRITLGGAARCQYSFINPKWLLRDRHYSRQLTFVRFLAQEERVSEIEQNSFHNCKDKIWIANFKICRCIYCTNCRLCQ